MVGASLPPSGVVHATDALETSSSARARVPHAGRRPAHASRAASQAVAGPPPVAAVKVRRRRCSSYLVLCRRDRVPPRGPPWLRGLVNGANIHITCTLGLCDGLGDPIVPALRSVRSVARDTLYLILSYLISTRTVNVRTLRKRDGSQVVAS